MWSCWILIQNYYWLIDLSLLFVVSSVFSISFRNLRQTRWSFCRAEAPENLKSWKNLYLKSKSNRNYLIRLQLLLCRYLSLLIQIHFPGRDDESTTSTSTGSRGQRGKNTQYYRDYRARKRVKQEKELLNRTSDPSKTAYSSTINVEQ